MKVGSSPAAPYSMDWSSIRSMRSAARIVRVSRASTTGSDRSSSSSSSISTHAVIELSGTRRSWLSSAASWETTVAAVWPDSGETSGVLASRSNRSSITWVTLAASVSSERRCSGVRIRSAGSITQSRPTISPLGAYSGAEA